MSFDGRKLIANQATLKGTSVTINSQTMLVTARDLSGNVVLCSGAAAPTDAGSGYAIGCIFRLTTGNGIGTTNYINEGSATSCDFNALTSSGGDVESVAAGSGLTGGGSSGALTLTAGAGRGITVRADNIDAGVDVYNNLGALGIGVLVNLSGFDTTLGITMTKADADAGIQATHVTIDAIANTTAGVVYPVGLATGDVTNNLDTSGRTIGDLVYLSGTAGGFVFTAPTGADQLSQVVGVVKVVSATIGQIQFFLGALRLLKLPTTMLQDSSVVAAKVASGALAPIKSAASEALTATADGLTTGLMTGLTSHAVVTSAAATNAVTLPASSAGLVGKQFTIWVGANGFELLTPALSGATVNGVDSDGTNQVDIPASTLSRVTLVDTDKWILENLTALGAVTTALIPDND